MGELLDALFVTRGHHELGFSSMSAYVVERAGESGRWGQETRALARRLRERNLRHLRGALVSGQVSWSTAEVLSRHAQPDTELALICASAGRTVRAVQIELAGDSHTTHPVGAGASTVEPERKSRRRWVTPAELAMLHTSRLLVSYLTSAHVSDEALLTALLGEAESNLASMREASTSAPALCHASPEERFEAATAALNQLLESEQARSGAARSRGLEASSNSGRVTAPARATTITPLEAASVPSDPVALDAAIRQLAAQLRRQQLELADLANEVLKRRSWRALGFETAAQYAELRLGLSLSCLEHKATLARRLHRHPILRERLRAGVLGTEAALLLGRLLGRRAESALVEAWVERARTRTYRCLRDEVDVVLLALSFDPQASRSPPGPDELEAAADIERRVQSGEVFRSMLGARSPGPQTSVTLSADLDDRSRAPNSVPPAFLRLSDELYQHWRQIEAEFHALAGAERSFLGFMCTSLWSAWLPYLEAWDDKWAALYRRDRHRCQNPVCGRRDVTPHHIVFRAHGGTDELENMVSLCSWCHLEGVHRGRIRVEGRAGELRWQLGRRQ